MKTITLLLDGVGDRSYESLGWKTPLQYAYTPNLDKIALDAQCGLMTPLREGIALGTDLAHMILFGYDVKEYPGRAVIDVIGENIDVSSKDLILRISWADVEMKEGFLINSRFTKELSDEEIAKFCALLSYEEDGYKYRVIHSYDSHGFLIVSGSDLTSSISDSDPFYKNQYVMKVEPFESERASDYKTSELINKFIKRSFDLLNNHDVNLKRKQNGLAVGNIILTKWAGMLNAAESFYVRNGMKPLLLGKSKLLNGLANYLEMVYEEYTDINDAIDKALKSNKEYIHLHTKDTDEASHKKDPLAKVKALEMIDKQLDRLLDFDGLLIVTADHSTPCDGVSIHSGESVPFMAKGKFIRRDNVNLFDEIACSGGSIYLKGNDFMHYIQNATDRIALHHLKAGNTHRNYRIRDVNKLL